MDVLADVVSAMRTGPAFSGRTELSSPWGLRFTQAVGAQFHVVIHGSCWLLPPDEGPPLALAPGDVVLLPQGLPHAIADHPQTPLIDMPALFTDGAIFPSGHTAEGTGARSVVLCGVYQWNRERPHPMFRGLPPVLHLPAKPGAHYALHTVVTLLREEIEAHRPGSTAVVPALVDTLFVLILRSWLDEQSTHPEQRRWSQALSDTVVRHALEVMHADPGRGWTVAELATAVGLSRAAFARRFTTAVGEPPLNYLTRWRMTTAARLLRTDSAPVASIAQQVGYTSEFAFAKAFKRDYGIAPGHYRRRTASKLVPSGR